MPEAETEAPDEPDVAGIIGELQTTLDRLKATQPKAEPPAKTLREASGRALKRLRASRADDESEK